MRNVNFVENGFACQVDFAVVRHAATNSGLPEKKNISKVMQSRQVVYFKGCTMSLQRLFMMRPAVKNGVEQSWFNLYAVKFLTGIMPMYIF